MRSMAPARRTSTIRYAASKRTSRVAFAPVEAVVSESIDLDEFDGEEVEEQEIEEGMKPMNWKT